MSEVQATIYRCECGFNAAVTQETIYEFAWQCSCGLAGVISWDHAQPPPIFLEDKQMDLWTVKEIV